MDFSNLAGTVYVARDGSGDYNCDGVNDQTEINQALQFVTDNPGYTTVCLKAGKYVIDGTIFIGSNTTLTGEPTAVLTIKDNAVWEIKKPMLENRDEEGNTNITICGFKIDGNRFNITQGINRNSEVVNIKGGQNYYDMIIFRSCSNIDVHGMWLTNNHNDGLLLKKCSGVKYYGNFIDEIGHDGLYANYCTDIQAFGNRIACRINSGLRAYQTNRVSFFDNTIYSNNTGGAGIEIQSNGDGYVMNDIKIFNNTIHDTVLAGIWIFGGMGRYNPEDNFVHIFCNKITHTGTRATDHYSGGIVANGFNLRIENNEIDSCFDGGIVLRDTFYPSIGQGYTAQIVNNTITRTRSSAVTETGYGVYNTLPGIYTVEMSGNRFIDNFGEDFRQGV